MDLQRYGFLVATLGEDGAQALAKAAERYPHLASVLVPRAILAWLQIQGEDPQAPEFEGELPGVTNSYLSFKKSDAEGKTFTGSISLGENAYGFEDATDIQLAASIGIALGTDAENIDPNLRDVDLQRLGKSIDLLAKARKAVEDIGMAKRQLDPALGYKFTHTHHDWEPGKIGWTRVEAHAPTGEKVGDVLFGHTKEGHIQPSTVAVEEPHQRQGIASAMYAHAEKVTGKKVVPGKVQTDEGQGLWAGNRQKPQFGLTPEAQHEHLWGWNGTRKAEPPGGAAPPQKQGEPLPAMTPQKQPQQQSAKKPATPKPGKGLSPVKPPASPAGKPAKQADAAQGGPQVKLTRSQTQKACPVCGLPQFKGERLVGCMCFSELAKSAAAHRTQDGFVVTFGSDWDAEAMEVFLEGLQGKARTVI